MTDFQSGLFIGVLIGILLVALPGIWIMANRDD